MPAVVPDNGPVREGVKVPSVRVIGILCYGLGVNGSEPVIPRFLVDSKELVTQEVLISPFGVAGSGDTFEEGFKGVFEVLVIGHWLLNPFHSERHQE